jgi:hypothetical protein
VKYLIHPANYIINHVGVQNGASDQLNLGITGQMLNICMAPCGEIIQNDNFITSSHQGIA